MQPIRCASMIVRKVNEHDDKVLLTFDSNKSVALSKAYFNHPVVNFDGTVL